MSQRLPPKARNELNASEQEIHDKFTAVSERSFGPNGEKFIYKEANDALIGPFPFFIASPPVGNVLHDLIFAFAKLPLPADAREVAILTVGGHFQAGYETYSHIPQAIAAGLSREQAETLQAGEQKPAGLDEACEVAYDVAHHLVTVKGALSQELWDRSVQVLGKEGTVGLLHYIGFYCYVCVALNGVDCGVPE